MTRFFQSIRPSERWYLVGEFLALWEEISSDILLLRLHTVGLNGLKAIRVKR